MTHGPPVIHSPVARPRVKSKMPSRIKVAEGITPAVGVFLGIGEGPLDGRLKRLQVVWPNASSKQMSLWFRGLETFRRSFGLHCA